jgi:putative transposase
MPWGLKRYYGTGSLHFITWSCYQRRPLLDTEEARDLLLNVLERMRERCRFAVLGYVVMPEHVHLLISEPGSTSQRVPHFSRVLCGRSGASAREIGHPGYRAEDPSVVVQAVKLGFTQRWRAARGVPGQFWQRRFYDFNVWSQQKIVEKVKYMHRNPVARGLVEEPDRWRWSSYRSYAYGEAGLVRINDWRWWEAEIRNQAG